MSGDRKFLPAGLGQGGPTRVQLSRRKGWRMPPNTVSAARPTRFGNPWSIAGAREAGYRGTDAQLAAYCVALYREWLTGSPGSLTRMLQDGEYLRSKLLAGLACLRGKNLACWCPRDQPCHTDVLLELANSETTTRVADART
jgi:hypothetical protein